MTDHITIICPVCGLLGWWDGEQVEWCDACYRLWRNPPDLPQLWCPKCERGETGGKPYGYE